MKNPFVTNGYVSPEYFCDREKETAKIVSLLTNENNIALISPRRLGKTDLLRHCFGQPEIKEHYHTFIIDIYATSSVRDFVNVFGKAVLDELRPKGKSVWGTFLNLLASLRSEITFDMNGQPTWGIGLGAITNPSATLDEIFSYLNNAGKPCLIAIDEFQQITKYADDPNIEAALRTHIQRCSNAHFVFSGSHRHLMGAMFTSPARPNSNPDISYSNPKVPYVLFQIIHYGTSYATLYGKHYQDLPYQGVHLLQLVSLLYHYKYHHNL